MNVLVIMTDTLRPDYVAGYRRPSDAAGLPGQLQSRAGIGARTPALDRFAAESTVFERAYAASFPTVPNRNDLHTGRFTFPHRGWSALPANVPCLAEAVSRAGYATQFYCDTPNQVPMGLHRGFAGWEWHRGQEGDRFVTDPRIEVDLGCPPEKLRGNGNAYRQYLKNRASWQSEEDHFAPRTIRSGMAWLQQHYEAERGKGPGSGQGGKGSGSGWGDHQPFFLWLDTFDPHEPWDAPPYYADWYDPGYTGEVLAHANYGRSDYMTPAELQHVKAIYAAEVSMVDKWIGRLLQQVDDLGFRENTAVIHLSDHGHYFGDHGLQGKPFRELLWLYEGLIQSALAVRLPEGRGGGRRVTSPALPPDVTATIVALTGADLPGLQGRSLVPAIDGGEPVREIAFTSRYPILAGEVTPCAITTEEWSYQYWPGAPEKERLYRLSGDPGQQRDLRAEEPEIARELRAAYLGWMAEQNAELAGWLQTVEREPAFRPTAPTLFRGML
ncbi:MAG: sulfatase [Chloroflexi bacterium]|nr:sulfatase [Chloroflexota bacterium]